MCSTFRIKAGRILNVHNHEKMNIIYLRAHSYPPNSCRSNPNLWLELSLNFVSLLFTQLRYNLPLSPTRWRDDWNNSWDPWRRDQGHDTTMSKEMDWMNEKKAGDMAIIWGKYIIQTVDGASPEWKCVMIFFHVEYIICTRLMTVKWDMQQKHGSPPRVMRNTGNYIQM